MHNEIERLQREKCKAIEKGQWEDAAVFCNCIGQELFKLGRFEDALRSHTEELEYCSMRNDELGKAVANRKIGECYMELNNFKKALTHQKLFLDLAVQQKSSVEEQRAWATLGRTYYFKFLYELNENYSKEITQCSLNRAEHSFHKALKLSESIKAEISPREYAAMRARLLLNIGLVYEQRDNLTKCAESIRHSIFLTKKFSLYEDLHRCQYSLASVYIRCKQYNFALRLIDESISSAKLLKDKMLICEAMTTKANVLLLLKDFEGAKTHLKKAYKLHSPITSDHEKIEQHLKIVIKICECEKKLLNIKHPSTRKSLLETIADGLAVMCCYKLAVEYYFATLECLELMNAATSEKASIYYSLAQTYADDGDYAEALKYLKTEFDCNQEKPVEQVKTLWKMADLNELQGDKIETENVLFKALNLAESLGDKKLRYLSLKRLYSHYEFSKEPSKMVEMEDKLQTFSEFTDPESDDPDIMETQEIFDGVNLSDLSDNTDSDIDNEMGTVKQAKRHTKRPETKRNELGETPLHRACIDGNVVMVKRLVENGHPVNVRDNCGWLPLHEACNHGYFEIVEYLLSKGAWINDRGGKLCDGITPLHDAAACGNIDIMELLINQGATVIALNNDGETALDALLKWRQRSESDLDEDILLKTKSMETRLKSFMKQAGLNMTNIGSPLKSEDMISGFSDESMESTTYIPAQTNEKRMHSSSSSEDDIEIYGNPHLNLTEETDLTDPNKITSEYQAVMSSIRYKAKHTQPEKQVAEKPPLGALVDEGYSNEWLIHDTKPPKSRIWKKRRHKIPKSNMRRTNHSMEKYLSISEIEADSTESLLNNNQTDRTGSDDENSLNEPQRSSNNETNRLFHVRVQIMDKIIFVPLHDELYTMEWLAEEASNRFQNLVGKKPHLYLMNKDGAIFSSTDLVKAVVQNNEVLTTTVSYWEQPPLIEQYKQNCKKNNILSCQAVENRLRPFETTSELNFSDIHLPTSQLMTLFKSLGSYHTLTHLNLSNNDVSDTLSEFISSIPSFTVLVSLNMSCCGLTTSDIKEIGKFITVNISSTPYFPKLEFLCLSYNMFGQEAASAFCTILKLLPLKVLRLRACYLTEDFFSDEFCDILSITTNLKELDMSENELNDMGIKKLLTFLPRNRIRKLDFSRTVSSNVGLGRYVCSYMSHSVPYLAELHLEGCYLKNEDVSFLCDSVKFCPMLSLINLSTNPGLTSDVFVKLVESCHMCNVPLSSFYAIGCFEWNNEMAQNFTKAFRLKILKKVVVNHIPESAGNVIFDVWKEVWENRAVFGNDVFCELGVDRLTLCDY